MLELSVILNAVFILYFSFKFLKEKFKGDDYKYHFFDDLDKK